LKKAQASVPSSFVSTKFTSDLLGDGKSDTRKTYRIVRSDPHAEKAEANNQDELPLERRFIIFAVLIEKDYSVAYQRND
jgi:hypothetical protein